LFAKFKIKKTMKNKTTTTDIILEVRTPLQNGRFPLKLRVTHDREARYFSVRDPNGKKIALSKIDFRKVKGEKPRGNYKDMAFILSDLEEIAIETINKLPVFSFEDFKKKYFGNHGDEGDLFEALRNTISKLKTEDRIGTASSYQCALTSLENYLYGKDEEGSPKRKKVCLFKKVDIEFLNKYEKWMRGNKKSPTTIGIYLRYVRACFNDAINRKIIDRDLYPFSRGKYTIPTGANIKKALTQNEISLITSYSALEGTNEEKYRDYWMFLFYCNGLNLKDMAKLKYENRHDDFIIFQREKTLSGLKGKPIQIFAYITQSLEQIIARWGNKPDKPENYIFPILQNGMSAKEEFDTARQMKKNINAQISRIAKKVGIKKRVTTNVARHSIATFLNDNGALMPFIKDTLGHSSQVTTEHYIARTPSKMIRHWAKVVEEATKIKTDTLNEK